MPTILRNHHVLAVHNVSESAKFFVNGLGFTIVNNPPGWIFIEKDQCMIMLGECPNDLSPGELGCHSYFAYLRVDDVDGYHAAIKKHDAKSVGEIGDKAWGMREFAVTTPDGHRLMIGQSKPVER